MFSQNEVLSKENARPRQRRNKAAINFSEKMAIIKILSSLRHCINNQIDMTIEVGLKTYNSLIYKYIGKQSPKQEM